MSLKMTEKITYQVDYFDLDRFIAEHYGHEFNFSADQEVSNDSFVQLHVESVSRLSLDERDRRRFDKFLQGEDTYLLARYLMNDLCSQGLIPAGTYVINVSW